MKIVGVIPSRYGSSRFPGKPLVLINGKPMIQWVYEHCKHVNYFDEVIIATDDDRIANISKQFGARIVMTSKECSSPTERVYHVSNQINADFYVMINGDEPCLPAQIISKCIPNAIPVDCVYVCNLMTPCENPSDVVDTTNIKIVTNKNGKCLYMSRSPIPFPKGHSVQSYRKFVGVTGFTKKALQFYYKTPAGEIEKAEDVDELRFIENGYDVEFIEVIVNSVSVDTSKDVQIVEKILNHEIQTG